MRTHVQYRNTILFFALAKMFRAWFPDLVGDLYQFAEKKFEFWRGEEDNAAVFVFTEKLELARKKREQFYLLMKFCDEFEPSYTGILEYKTRLKDARVDWEHSPIYATAEVQYPHWDGPLFAAAILHHNEWIEEVRWQNQYGTQGHYMRRSSLEFQKWQERYEATLLKE